LKTSLSRALNRQSKHRKTEENAMAAILRAFILFSKVLKALNFAFGFASLLNRHSYYESTAYQTNRSVEDSEPVFTFRLNVFDHC